MAIRFHDVGESAFCGPLPWFSRRLVEADDTPPRLSSSPLLLGRKFFNAMICTAPVSLIRDSFFPLAIRMGNSPLYSL